jgi:nucleotide-binding universal stress UspA family protein
MYKRILVALDGSDTSLHALQHAIKLARGLSASLRIVHVVDMGWLPLGPELAIDTEVMNAARYSAGKNVMARIRDAVEQTGFRAEIAMLETGTPTEQVAEAIARESERWQADLVVLGTHGRRGVQRLLIGSVAEQMTRRSAVPVLLVPVASTQ